MNEEFTVKRSARSIQTFLEMVKISHSIFALPFAVAAAFLAAGKFPELVLLLKIIIACVFARTGAMSFNRWADRKIDALNPRTANRAIAAGLLKPWFVLTAAIACAAGFILVAYWINSLAFTLSPITILILFGYSYTKRFTHVSHLVLGLALGLSPLGAWIAVRGEFDVVPILLGLSVLFWTAGFDIIYACQDTQFDRENKLHSIPGRWGIAGALWVSRFFHLSTVTLLVTTGVVGQLGPFYYSGVAAVCILLIYEQSLVKANDLSRVTLAFFNLNGLVSLVFMVGTILEVML